MLEKDQKIVVEGNNVFQLNDFVVRLFSQFENNGKMLIESNYTGNYGSAMYSILKNNLCPTETHSNMAALISYWAFSNHISSLNPEIPFIMNRGLLLFEYQDSLFEDFKHFLGQSTDLNLNDNNVIKVIKTRFEFMYMLDFYNVKEHLDYYQKLNSSGIFKYSEFLKVSIEKDQENFKNYVENIILEISNS